MKQSVGLIFLQITGILLGLFSVFYVAAKLSPEVYAIVGVQAVIYGIISVFSNSGFETYATRNVLHWKENGEIDKIQNIVTQAIAIRTIFAIILQIPLLFYIVYISDNKFNGEHLHLLALISLFAIPKAMLDAANLILKSFNRYFIAVFSSYSVQIFGKLIALFLFTLYGFEVYIFVLIALPLIILIPVLYLLKDSISIKELLDISSFKINFQASWKFAVATYASYPFNYLDSLLVSLFLPAEFLGSFTMGKKVYQIGKQFIENVFDPMIQKLVQFKTKMEIFKKKLRRVFAIQRVLLLISIVFIPLLFIYLNDVIILLGIDKYPFLYYLIILAYVGQVVHIAMKIKLNFIMLFYSSDLYLITNVLYGVITIASLLLFFQLPFRWIFGYSITANLFMYFYAQYIYSKHKGFKNISIS